MNRFDLAASDLEEARRGFLIVGTVKNIKANPLKCAKAAVNLRVLFDKMHANRIKGLHFELPRAISLVSNIILNVLPAKIRERLSVGKKLASMKIYAENQHDFDTNVPKLLGGAYDTGLQDWFRERLAHQSEADKRVAL